MNRALLTLVCLTIPCIVFGASVTLDPSVRYQTIDGFGAYGAQSFENWAGDDAFVATVVNDLGLSILRVEIPADQGSWGNIASWIKKLSTAADASNMEPIKFIASSWSPPASMKTNNSVTGGGSLKPESYAAFAEYIVSFVRTIKEQAGVELYAVSIQNEPFFAQGYKSCVYDPMSTAYRDVVKKVGSALRDAGYKTVLFGPEDVGDVGRVGRYTVPCMLDSVGPDAARNFLKILAVHGYNATGIIPATSGSGTQFKGMAGKYGLRFWMTETSGYSPNTWERAQVQRWDGSSHMASGGFGLALDIFNALVIADLAGWVWWTLSDFQNSSDCLFFNGNKQKQYYAHKHFSRYIRPGAVRFKAGCDDQEVGVAAFSHAANKTVTLIFINLSESDKTATLQGDLATIRYKRYVSSASLECAEQAAVDVGTVSLPKRSVTTIISDNVTVGVDPSAKRPMNLSSRPETTGERYTLVGARISSGAVARGIVIERVSGKNYRVNSAHIQHR